MLLPEQRKLYLQFGYNEKDFAGVSQLTYYPKIVMNSLNNFTFFETNDRLPIRIYGENFINTVEKLECRLTRVDYYLTSHRASFIHFDSPESITCIFDVEPYINYGEFYISVANNDVQFVRLEQPVTIQ